MTTPVIRAALERLLHDLIEGKMLDGAIAAASAALAEQPKTEQPPKNCWLDDEPDLCPTPCVFDDSSEAIYNCCFAIKLNAEEKPKETCKYYRAALAEQPARPTDEELLQLSQWHQVSCTMCDGCVIYPLQPGTDMRDAVLSFARAVWDLAVSSQLILDNSPQPPADGEVVELVAALESDAECVEVEHYDLCNMTADQMRRAAELLEQRLPTPIPVAERLPRASMVPTEYIDLDSGARIVSEPAEDWPGGCWVVRNSRHINPCKEFHSAEAAYEALQQANALPVPTND
jgi:hypothetical protein